MSSAVRSLSTSARKTIQCGLECVRAFARTARPHHLKNNSTDDATIIEVGTRVSGDAVSYATDDLVAVMGLNGQWVFEHENGELY